MTMMVGTASPTLDATSAVTASSTFQPSRTSRNRSILPLTLVVCCILVSGVNIWQAHTNASVANQSTKHGSLHAGIDTTAVHAAVREFRAMSDQNLKSKLQLLSLNTTSPSNKGDAKTPNKMEKQAQTTPLEERGKPSRTTTIQATDAVARYPPLMCETFGGPSAEDAQELVYWQDIPSDTQYVSPFFDASSSTPKYMTFEPDGGGWNNIRMAMETVLGLAIAMGRTLVLPPEQRMYLLGKGRGGQKTDFSFSDFFPLREMAAENLGLTVITTREFLEREALTGHMRDKNTGQVTFPPGNVTDWDGKDVGPLKEWLRNSTYTPIWSPGACLAAFPSSGRQEDADLLKQMQKQIHAQGLLTSPFLDDPLPVDAEPMERMRENLAGRQELCVYDEEMRKERTVHFMCYHKMRVRLLVHFYAFLYFEDWREDLWMKRFMRDHVRYIDEIQCAAARIVKALRSHVRSRTGDPSGAFDSFHVRRGDFQYKATRIEATQLIQNTEDLLMNGTTIYIATDERNKKFFDPLKERYDVKFMDDFLHLLEGVNSNYYGMIDQLVAARGRLFFGCWHSTFTGFIHRMRGYYSTRDKLPGHDKGELPSSYYYVPVNHRGQMHRYAALHGAFFNREFPTSWRDLNKGIGHLPPKATSEISVQQ